MYFSSKLNIIFQLTGFANRYCDGDGYWREVDVMGCSSVEIMELQNQVNYLYTYIQ